MKKLLRKLVDELVEKILRITAEATLEDLIESLKNPRKMTPEKLRKLEPAKPKTSRPKKRAQLHGQYMGLMQGRNAAVKARAKKLYREHGLKAAISYLGGK